MSDLNAQFEEISDKGSEDAAKIFARNAATIAFDDLPPAAVRAAKLSVLDTLGVILAATGVAPGLDRFAELAKLDGGRPESDHPRIRRPGPRAFGCLRERRIRPRHRLRRHP